MKFTVVILLALLFSCNESINNESSTTEVVSIPTPDKRKVQPSESDTIIKAKSKIYSNARFRNVTVQKEGPEFRLQGQAQIFEASFSWVIEDGHNELQKGFNMTDAGAPEWGKFDFTVKVEKERPNSVLHIILFETSAQDGSRKHELPIPLK